MGSMEGITARLPRCPGGIVYEHRNSFSPIDGISRHPVQFYDLLGDMAIAGVLIKIRYRLPEGATFFVYLVLFSVLRFFLFFVRGNVPEVLFGLKNAQLTALVVLAVALPALIVRCFRDQPFRPSN